MEGTVVLECGSSHTRAGFAGQDEPQLITRSAVGRPKVKATEAESKTKDKAVKEEVFFGNEAFDKRDALRLRFPVEWGLVTNWDDAEILWKYVLEEKLSCDMEETPLLMLEGAYMNPKINRERMTEIAFETFHVPAFYLTPSSHLILLAAGRCDGVAIDVGEEVIRTVPVHDGHHMPHAILKFEFGSRYLTTHLRALLAESRGVSLKSFGSEEGRKAKEQFAYVAQNFEQEMQTFCVNQEKPYELPSGEVISLGRERFQCVEPIFRPSLLGMEMMGLPQHVVNTVRRCNPDIRQKLLSNVILAGATSALPGLASRLQHDLEQELKCDSDCRKYSVQVLAPPGGDLLAWKGGSMMASNPSFEKMCISSGEYDEYGPNLVHSKCF